MGITISRTLTRGIALPVGVALVMGVGASGAHAVPDDPLPRVAVTGPPLPAFGAPGAITPVSPRLEAALGRVSALPVEAGPTEMAAALFPDDEVLRAEAVLRLAQVEASLAIAQADAPTAPPEEEMRTQAAPAFVLAALPYIAQCTKGALVGAALDRVVHLAWRGEWGAAEDIAEDAVAGCIGWLVPWQALRRKIAGEIVGAVIWIIVHTRS